MFNVMSLFAFLIESLACRDREDCYVGWLVGVVPDLCLMQQQQQKQLKQPNGTKNKKRKSFAIYETQTTTPTTQCFFRLMRRQLQLQQ